jgi:hypothetical protein
MNVEKSAGRILGVPIGKMARPCTAPSPRPRPPRAEGSGVLPPDNYLGPAAGKMTVYENLKRLQYDLVRAEEKARQVEAVKEDLTRKHRIYVDGAARIKGESASLQFRRT